MIAGCQESPDEDIVVNKSESSLAEAIADTGTNNDTEHVPETCVDSFICSGENIQVTVDADIEVLGDAFPVVSVQPHQITVDEVRQWADVLFHGETAYEPDNQYSKKEIEEMVLNLKQSSDLDALTEEYGNIEDAKAVQEQIQQMIEDYEAMYDDAPDETDRKLCDWQFHPADYYDADAAIWAGNEQYETLKDTDYLNAVGYDAEENTPYLSAFNRDKDDYKLNGIHFQLMTSDASVGAAKRREIKKDEAISMADETVSQLGFEDWKLWSVDQFSDEESFVYRMTYSPCYFGVPTLVGFKNADLKSEDTYAANYYYSLLEIVINNGIINYVALTSPTEVTEVRNENVNTLAFTEIYECFKNQMQNKYTISSFIVTGDNQMPGESIEIRVTTIKEGMFRIREKNEDYRFMMVPAWLFVGEVFIDGSSWGETDLCYINAIDGSIIDPLLGY